MSPPYYAFVRFRDKAKTPFVVPSTDIKDFKPVHSTDFLEKVVYEVYWQEEAGSFDGFYEAIIICMGASLSELKENALKLGIRRMPSNFKSVCDEEDRASKLESIGKEETPVKTRCTELRDRSRKRRIEAILQNVAGETDEAVKKLVAQGQSDVDLDATIPLNTSDISTKKLVSPKKSLPASVTPESPTQIKGDDCVLDSDSGSKKHDEKVEEDKAGSDDDSESEVESDGSSNSGDFSDSDSSEDTTARLSSEISSLKMEIRSLNVEIKSLKSCCKISEESRLKLYAEFKELSAEKDKLWEEKKSGEKGNLEFTRLKDRNRKLVIESSALKEENERLISLLRSAKSLLSTGLDKNVKLISEPKCVKKALDFNIGLSSDVPKKDIGGNFNDYEENILSPFEFTSPFKSTPVKSVAEPEKSLSYSGSPVKSPEKVKKLSKSKGLSSSEMDTIALKVKKDITGECPMSTTSAGKYDIGGGVSVSKEKWDKGIRTQGKNSLFVTKLSHAVYGMEGLKKRTVGIPKDDSKEKKMATPCKVDAIVACLQGKILAEHPTFPNVREAAEVARTYLSRKMQDAARPPRESNRSKVNEEEEKKKRKKKDKKKAQKTCD